MSATTRQISYGSPTFQGYNTSTGSPLNFTDDDINGHSLPLARVQLASD
jgi:hypothetical protein